MQRSVLAIHGAHAICVHRDSFLRPLDAHEQVLQPSDAVNSSPGQQTSDVAGGTPSASLLPKKAEISAVTVIVMAAPTTTASGVGMM